MRNTVSITVNGNLTDDPELRFTPSGTAVVKFTVAVNPRTFDKDSGQWKDGEPSFYRCTAWKQLAENIANSLAKGHRVIVDGTLSERRWKDVKEPEKMRSGWEVTADAVGPDLSYATATVKKMARGSAGDVPPDDPWSTGSSQPPARAGAGFSDDEPPF
ncbi:single-stranded DNA-binding protein [Phytohabitans rumicis]|uniref:Single-stranded DNA-binding protein n=1 Tax=Phytohabitans rumicis TaxID=1076125 RepID=A0A6V8LEI6_9ACTN|nr:single-stranded DNA-binding protein [Phytohabitans rumicis]GFJ92457.1 single-stranded DNA-binding protein [Phytohabitans rumicis]